MRVLKPCKTRQQPPPATALCYQSRTGLGSHPRRRVDISRAVTIECCSESTKAGKFCLELATIPVPADNGLTQYYTEEASGLFRAPISRRVSNGTVTVTPLISRGRPDRKDRIKVL